MYFGRTGRAAAAVASRPAAKQNDNIARIGIFADYIFSRRSSHHGADLHTLRHIRRMINFFDIAGRQTDLVAVGRIAARRAAHKLLLRQLTLHRLLYRNGRIRRAGHAHCLIYIRTSRKRISDRAAQTGRRAAERFDLGRMIMRLVLKADKPLLCHAVDLYRNDDRAGVNFVGFFHILKLAVLFELFHRHQRQIHQADKFILSALQDLFSCIQIGLIRRFNRGPIVAVLKRNIF